MLGFSLLLLFACGSTTRLQTEHVVLGSFTCHLRLPANYDSELYAKRRKHVRVESLPMSLSFINAISAIGDGMPIHTVVTNARCNVADGMDKEALKYLASMGSILGCVQPY